MKNLSAQLKNLVVILLILLGWPLIIITLLLVSQGVM